jgi:hypothetical protein
MPKNAENGAAELAVRLECAYSRLNKPKPNRLGYQAGGRAPGLFANAEMSERFVQKFGATFRLL